MTNPTTIVNHENEHSLYDIIALNRGKKADILSSLPEVLKKSPEKFPKFLDKTVEELLFETDQRRISRFANEVMAYLLNNEDPNTPTDEIVSSTMMRLLDTDLYGWHKLTATNLESMKSGVMRPLNEFKNAHSEDDMIGKFIDQCAEKIESMVTEKGIKKNYISIIEAVSSLMKTYPNRKNYIRALLAGENPMKWQEIVKAEQKWRDEGDWRQKIKNKSQKEMEEISKKQLEAVKIFLELISEETTNTDAEKDAKSVEKKEDEREVIFNLDKWKKGSYVGNYLTTENNKVFLEIGDEKGDENIIIDSLGKNISNRALKISRMIDAGGKVAYEARRLVDVWSKSKTKDVILVQGEKRAIGNEYQKIGTPIYYRGKIIFPAQQDNGLWRIVDEDGKFLSDELENINNLTNVGDGFCFEVTERVNYKDYKIIINDKGRKFEPEEFKEYKKKEGIIDKFSDDNLKKRNGKVYLDDIEVGDGKVSEEVYSKGVLKYILFMDINGHTYLVNMAGEKLLDVSDKNIHFISNCFYDNNQDYFDINKKGEETYSLINLHGEELVKDCDSIFGIENGHVIYQKGQEIIRQKLNYLQKI